MAEFQHVQGLRELEQNLKMLGEEMRERGTKLMMARAAVPMRDDARRRVPILKEPDQRRRPGTVRDAVKIWRHRKTPYAATYYVGVRALSSRKILQFVRSNSQSGKIAKGSDNPNDPFYWRFIELGTSKQPARPFLRPAFESRKQESVQVAVEEARKFIRRIRFKRLKSIVSRLG